MKTRDLSPYLIGKTVRVEKPGIAGTHNYIEGVLENFDFDTERAGCMGNGQPVRIYAVGLTATIAGLDFELNGREPLTVIEKPAPSESQTELTKIQNDLRAAGHD